MLASDGVFRRRVSLSDRGALVGHDGLRRRFPPRCRGGKRHELFAFQPHLDHVRTALVVVVKLLAVHAVDALVDIDGSLRVDGLDRTLLGAALAGRAAFRPPLQPLEHADPARNGECSAQRAKIAAVDPFDEKAGREHGERKDDEGPFAGELQDDRRLERLHFRKHLGKREGVERQPEQAEKDDVFDRPEPLVQAPGHSHLRHLQPSRDIVGQFLQRAERA